MFKKKLIAIAAAATITVSLCACSGSGGGSSTASQASTEAASSAAEESTQGDSSSGNKYIAKPKFIQDDEVNIKAVECRTWGEMALDELKKGLQKTREMFGFSEDELSVDWRFKEEEVLDVGERNAVPAGDL